MGSDSDNRHNEEIVGNLKESDRAVPLWELQTSNVYYNDTSTIKGGRSSIDVNA